MILYRIQAHPSRKHLLPELKAGLPPAVVVEHSSDPPSPYEGYRLCLQDLPPAVEHLCVIQDDAIVCKDFQEKLEKAVAEKPDNLLSLFVAGLRNQTHKNFLSALKDGESWAQIAPRDIHHVVALCWPVPLIHDFLWWIEMNQIPGPQPPRSDDAAVGNWALRTQQTVWAHVPCLVEHPDTQPSTIGRRPTGGKDKGRVAIAFADKIPANPSD